jgi:S1-C subfamily serine protease
VGLVSAYGSGAAVVVPAPTVLAEAERLLRLPPGVQGTLGVEVQELTPALAAVAGAPAGVVVAWVSPDGAAAGKLAVGDVIETFDGQDVRDRRYWDVRLARLRADQMVTLGVRQRGQVQQVALVAAAVGPSSPRPSPGRVLGLILRVRPGLGSEVLRVEPGSAADRAGLLTGDVITLVAEAQSPTPGRIREAFGALGEGQRVLIALTRSGGHQVTTLAR